MKTKPVTSLIVYTTFPDQTEAKRIGKILIEERLAACINIFDRVLSLYHWQGSLHEDEEFAAFIKTNEGASEQLMARLKELHPYEVPAILLIKPSTIDHDYDAWIKKQLSEPS